jgi:hypothetical protein
MLAPFLAAGLLGLRAPEKEAGAERRAIAWFTLVLAAGHAYFTSSFSYDSWGWTTGPRHLTGLVPFLLLPAGLWLEQRGAHLRGAFAGLIAASVLATGAVSFINYIPDDVSEPLFGLVVPLVRRGLHVPSVPDALGLTPAASGWLLLGLLSAGGLVGAAWLLEPLERAARRRAAALAAVVVVAFLSLHAAFARRDDSGFLADQWWTAEKNRATVSLVSPDRSLTCPR